MLTRRHFLQQSLAVSAVLGLPLHAADFSEAKADALLSGFANPPRKFAAIPWWTWDGDMDLAEMKRQIVEIANSGVRGFYIFGLSGLKLEYLGEDWMERVRWAVKRGVELGLEIYIYDDFDWPTGLAKDRVIQRQELRQRAAFAEIKRVQGPSRVSVPIPEGKLIAAAAAPRRTREVVLPDRWRFRLVRGTASVPIPKWEATQAIIHPETTMGFRYRAQFRVKQKPERLALLVDNADTRFHSNRVKCDYNCTINAEFAPKLGFNTTFDRRMREFDLTGIVQVGENDLVLEYQHRAWLGAPILPLLTLCGSFAVEDGAITRAAERDTAAVSWTELGYPHFSGAASYAQSFDWQPMPGARVLLRCAEIRDHARIRLNGQPAADLPWAPWEADITTHLRPGRNDLEIEVINTNTNFVEGQPAPSGLFGAVTLIVETV